MKNLLRRLIESLVKVLGSTRLGKAISEALIKAGLERVETVQSRGVVMKLAVPNSINRFRAKSFSSKEPETLDWIDQLPIGSKLWDIGANIGLYSIYAAQKRKCRVVAFEPSVFNLELLARNLFLNDLQNQASILPVALNDGLGINQLRMTTTEWGGALSSFGQSFGWDGLTMEPTFSFSTLGISMDEVVSLLRLDPPDFIKLDVDGIEHIILRGGKKVLAGVRGILLEINEGFHVQKEEAERHLKSAGLKLITKSHAPMFDNSQFANLFNQSWSRD